MTKHKLIIILTSCLTLGAIGGTLRPPQHVQRKPPGLRRLTDDEKKETMEKWFDDQQLKERIASYEYLAERTRQAMRNELRISEAQWRIIEPKYERQISFMWRSYARANHRVTTVKDTWIKFTESKSGKPKTFAELSEAEKAIDELIDLMRREDTSDEELRKQIDALQQAREKARKEWPKAKQELSATLTTPRQEAVFLLFGNID